MVTAGSSHGDKDEMNKSNATFFTRSTINNNTSHELWHRTINSILFVRQIVICSCVSLHSSSSRTEKCNQKKRENCWINANEDENEQRQKNEFWTDFSTNFNRRLNDLEGNSSCNSFVRLALIAFSFFSVLMLHFFFICILLFHSNAFKNHVEQNDWQVIVIEITCWRCSVICFNIKNGASSWENNDCRLLRPNDDDNCI